MGMKCEAKEHASLLTNKEPERDPRINPMPGDVLRKKYKVACLKRALTWNARLMKWTPGP